MGGAERMTCEFMNAKSKQQQKNPECWRCQGYRIPIEERSRHRRNPAQERGHVYFRYQSYRGEST